ncbi:uncharacterized protein LOC135378309 [Ornithodoros turicata]|uniref:uncharacterized protein LOC135378309 n=1 Tax=Ornithodoros turicata TaxID=34597 RepID=UPI003139CD87
MAVPQPKTAYPRVQPGQRIDTTSYELRVTHPLRCRSASEDGRTCRQPAADNRVHRSPSAETQTRDRKGIHELIYRSPSLMSVVSIHEKTFHGYPQGQRPVDGRFPFSEKSYPWQGTADERAMAPSLQVPLEQRTPSTTMLAPPTFPVARTTSGTALVPAQPGQPFRAMTYQTPQRKISPTGSAYPPAGPVYRFPAEATGYERLRRTASGTLLGRVSPSGQYPGQQLVRTPSGTVLGRMSAAAEFPGQQLVRTPSGTLIGPVTPGSQLPGQRLMQTPSGRFLAPVRPPGQFLGYQMARRASMPTITGQYLPGQPTSYQQLRRTASGVLLAPVSPSRQYPGQHLLRTPSGTMLGRMSPVGQFPGQRLVRTPSGTLVGPVSPRQQFPGQRLLRTPSGTILAPVGPPRQQLIRTPSGTRLVPMSPGPYGAMSPGPGQPMGYRPIRRAASATFLPPVRPSQTYFQQPFVRSPRGTGLGGRSPFVRSPGQMLVRTPSGTLVGPVSPMRQFPGQRLLLTQSGTVVAPVSPPMQRLVRTPSGTVLAPMSPGGHFRGPPMGYQQLRRTGSGTLLAPVSPSRPYFGQRFVRTPSGTVLGRMSPVAQFPGQRIMRTPSGTLVGPVSPRQQFPGQRLLRTPGGTMLAPVRQQLIRTPSGTLLAPVSPGQYISGQPMAYEQLRRTASGSLLAPVSPSRQYVGQQLVQSPSGTMLGRMSPVVRTPGQMLLRTPSGTLVGPVGSREQFPGQRLLRTPGGTMLAPVNQEQQFVRTSSGTLLAPMSPTGQHPAPPLVKTSSGTLLAPVSPLGRFPGQTLQRTTSGTLLVPAVPAPGLRSPSETVLAPSRPTKQYVDLQIGYRSPEMTYSGTSSGQMTPRTRYLSQSRYGLIPSRPQLLSPRPSRLSLARPMYGHMSPSQMSLGAQSPRRPWLRSWMPRLFGPRSPMQRPRGGQVPPSPQRSWLLARARGGSPVSWSPPRSPVRTPSQVSLISSTRLENLRQYRRKRHVLLEWIVLWVFIVTLAVVLLAIVVVQAFHQPRLDEIEVQGISVMNRLLKVTFIPNDSVDQHIVLWPREKYIRAYLKELTKNVHLAGTVAGAATSEYVEEVLKSNWINHTGTERFTVLLSLPNSQKPNTVAVKIGATTWRPMWAREQTFPGIATEFSPPFNAYSAIGNITQGLIYCNRCLKDDFETLSSLKVSTWRKVCLCRYSPDVSPGTAMMHAEENSVGAVLFFLDPADVAPEQGKPVFPHSWWMPESALRRSNLRADNCIGDPSTRGYASRAAFTGLQRTPVSQVAVPEGLSQPITYRAANDLLNMMQGTACPGDWAPKLQAACNIGEGTSTTVRIVINNKLDFVNIDNVLAYIKGAVEPDRYVVIGIPMDAWSAGAVAPGTAVAQALEVSRILGALVQDKLWKPRRSIVMAGWDGHVFGHIGSTEYVEGRRQTLMIRAVVYLNSDMCSSGPEFMVSASPTIATSFEEVSRLVPHYIYKKHSYYDVWKAYYKAKMSSHGKPKLPSLRGGGSHRPMVQLAGVPSLDVSFGNNYTHDLYFPAYGTGYDTLNMVEHFTDPHLKATKMCAQLIGLMARRWADSEILPYDLKRLRNSVYRAFDELHKKHLNTLTTHGIELDMLRNTIMHLGTKLDEAVKHIQNHPMENPIEIRQLNDRIMRVERIFVQGVSNVPGATRNMLFGWSSSVPNTMTFFPILDELLTKQATSSADHEESIRVHISHVAHGLRQAADFVDFSRVV